MINYKNLAMTILTWEEWVFGFSYLDEFVCYPLAQTKDFQPFEIPDTYTDLR